MLKMIRLMTFSLHYWIFSCSIAQKKASFSEKDVSNDNVMMLQTANWIISYMLKGSLVKLVETEPLGKKNILHSFIPFTWT